MIFFRIDRLSSKFLLTVAGLMLCCYFCCALRASDIAELLGQDLSATSESGGIPPPVPAPENPVDSLVGTASAALGVTAVDSANASDLSSVIANLADSQLVASPEVPAALVEDISTETDNVLSVQPTVADHSGVPGGGKSCEAAVARAAVLALNMLDLSECGDFAANGDNAFNKFYQLLTSTSSFGTHSRNIYLDLSKTGVTTPIIANWAKIFSDDGKVVIWNLSYNDSVDDSMIDAVVLSNTYHLNLAHTSVTDAGIAKMVNSIRVNGIGELRSIQLDGSKVTAGGVEMLRAAMKEAAAAAEGKDGQKRTLFGNSGVIFTKGAGRGFSQRGRYNRRQVPVMVTPPIPGESPNLVTDALASTAPVADVGNVSSIVTSPVVSSGDPEIDALIAEAGKTADVGSQILTEPQGNVIPEVITPVPPMDGIQAEPGAMDGVDPEIAALLAAAETPAASPAMAGVENQAGASGMGRSGFGAAAPRSMKRSTSSDGLDAVAGRSADGTRWQKLKRGTTPERQVASVTDIDALNQVLLPN
ncbi:MAG: hypothetical protein LBC25_02770 [Holosporales bacterium]|jgi:hypothetical protein|nr:hypothetical protein [Holosporales bacterium]